MSGIVGFMGLEDNPLLSAMAKELVRNDSERIVLRSGKNFGLASAGANILANKEGTIFLCFFGEINRDITKQNSLSGSHDDFLESILDLYEKCGSDGLSKLDGDFSLAIIDTEKENLVLCRDPVGIKSLYYTLNNNVLFFSSELKALLKNDDIRRDVNYSAIYNLLRFTYFPTQETAFKNLLRVPPASILVYTKGIIQLNTYHENRIKKEGGKSEEYYIKRLLQLLENSIEKRLNEDSPVGSLLSGGMDSSSVVSLLSRLSKTEVNTFCIGFENNQEDLKNARFVADYFGTNHKEVIVNSEDVKLLPYLIKEIDEPLINSIPAYSAFKLAKKSVDLVFLGRGGDELFGGYSRFKLIDTVDNLFYRRTPHFLSSLISKGFKFVLDVENVMGGSAVNWDKSKKIGTSLSHLDNRALFYTSVTPSFIGTEINKLVLDNILVSSSSDSLSKIFEPYFVGNSEFLNQALMVETRIKLVNDILLIDDRMAISNNLNERVPFLDIDLIDFSFTVPSNLKIKGDTRKYVLRKTMSRMLPKEIVQRPKGGQFFMNSFLCFEKGLNDYVDAFLKEGFVFNNLLKKDKSIRYLDGIISQKPNKRLKYQYDLLMQLIGIDMWHRIYFDNEDPDSFF